MSELNDLNHATTFFLCAYAISEGQTIYGDIVSFRTRDLLLPGNVTSTPSGITANSALTIESIGDFLIFACF